MKRMRSLVYEMKIGLRVDKYGRFSGRAESETRLEIMSIHGVDWLSLSGR